MMPADRRLARFAAAALAPLGVVGAHILAFRASAGAAHSHDQLLAATGHGPWWWLAAVAVTLAAYRVVVTVGRASPGRSRPETFAGAALILTLVHTGAFTVLEALERMSAGLGAGAILHEPAVGLGLLIQLATALIAATILVLLVRVVSWLQVRPAEVRHSAQISWRSRADQRRAPAAARRPAAPRGPPALL